jgi:diacylglycerol kinase family enzyme/membrane-associated phospholipid phosphatase
MRGWLARAHEVDQALFERAATLHAPALDAVLPRLTRSADHSVLWLGVATALAASRGRRRRAAVRGLLSLALASATANVPAKLAVRRARPHRGPVPLPRQLRRQPSSSSFPSGHSASAAAFATGVALETPALAAPVGLLAAGVAYGRVHTGVHYPGDVAAGLALGGAAALALTRVWPVRPDRPAVASPALSKAPALTDGEGLVLVVNSSAGSSPTDLEERVRAALPRAEVVVVDGPDVGEALEQAADRAAVLGVCGGDGTVSCAAAVALEHDLPLAVFPGGTLDHFAGELGLSSVDDVIDALRDGEAAEVSVGSAAADGDGLTFLNTFALGVYPDLVRVRERYEDALGKWPALVVALVQVLGRATPLVVEVDGKPRRLWTLFAGNGRYHPDGFAPSWRERLDAGCLDVRLLYADAPLARTRLVAAVLTGRLGRSRVHEQQVVARLEVRSDGPLRIARDGESHDGPSHLRLHTTSRSLVVYRPS